MSPENYPRSSEYITKHKSELHQEVFNSLQNEITEAFVGNERDEAALRSFLLDYHTEKLKPEFDEVWQNMLNVLVNWADVSEVADTRVEQWFMAPTLPELGSGKWESGLIKVSYSTFIPGMQQYSNHIIGRVELDKLKIISDHNMVVDENNFRSRCWDALLESDAYIDIEIYETSEKPFQPNGEFVADYINFNGLFGKSRQGSYLMKPLMNYQTLNGYFNLGNDIRKFTNIELEALIYNLSVELKFFETQLSALRNDGSKVAEPRVYLSEVLAADGDTIELIEP